MMGNSTSQTAGWGVGIPWEVAERSHVFVLVE